MVIMKSYHRHCFTVSADTSVTFADVAGIDEVRAELEEMVQFLRCPQHI